MFLTRTDDVPRKTMKPHPKRYRKDNRFQAGLPATIQVDGRELDCTAHDLSRSGTLLTVDLPQLDVDEVRVALSTPAGDLQLSIDCRIVRNDVAPEGEGRRLAVEFLKINQDDRVTLEALVSRIVEGVSPAALAEIPPDAKPPQIREALEVVPVPHRIQLALRCLPPQREIMMHDNHLQVIDALSRNPGLLPHEAMSIVRRGNLLPQTLETFGKDPRWANNEQIRVKVATHRNTPFAVAEQLIGKMSPASLQRVIRAPGLKPALRDKLLHLIPGVRRPGKKAGR